MVLPGGTADERAASQRLAKRHAAARWPRPPWDSRDAAALLAHARCVAGVDTGLTHLAVALGVPTVGIYCATRPELTGLHAANARERRRPGRRAHAWTRSLGAFNRMIRGPVRASLWLAARAPIVLARLAWRSRKQPGYLERIWASASAVTRPRRPAPRIWIHAVSVGETRAAVPLVEALARALPRTIASSSRT